MTSRARAWNEPFLHRERDGFPPLSRRFNPSTRYRESPAARSHWAGRYRAGCHLAPSCTASHLQPSQGHELRPWLRVKTAHRHTIWSAVNHPRSKNPGTVLRSTPGTAQQPCNGSTVHHWYRPTSRYVPHYVSTVTGQNPGRPTVCAHVN